MQRARRSAPRRADTYRVILMMVCSVSEDGKFWLGTSRRRWRARRRGRSERAERTNWLERAVDFSQCETCVSSNAGAGRCETH